MFFELLCVRRGSCTVFTRVKVRNRAVGVVDNLYVFAERCLDQANPLGMDFSWVDMVNIATVVGSKIETNRLGDKTMVLRRVPITNHWSSDEG
jgi:hypothetical protein